jgi:hypothetical protein
MIKLIKFNLNILWTNNQKLREENIYLGYQEGIIFVLLDIGQDFGFCGD